MGISGRRNSPPFPMMRQLFSDNNPRKVQLGGQLQPTSTSSLTTRPLTQVAAQVLVQWGFQHACPPWKPMDAFSTEEHGFQGYL